MEEYLAYSEQIFFKHVVTKSPRCDTYSMHTHNTYELIWFLGGSATHVIEDRKYKLRRGDLILIRPMHYHFIQIDGPADYERYDILFDPERHGVEGLECLPDGLEVLNLTGNTVAEEIFRRCDLYRKRCDAEVFSRLLPHLLSELFYSLALFPQLPVEERAATSPLVSGALAYINENLCTIRSIDEVASHLFVSKSYLFRIFRAELHRTPKKYMMDKRLLLAQRRLLSGERPTEVGERCGFSDYTTFYRNYFAFFGHSPSEERHLE